MSKITLSNVGDLRNFNTAVNTINSNSFIVEEAIDNTLSRDGTAPNQMEASLDMNSNRILNLPLATSEFEPLRVADAEELSNGGTIIVSQLPVAGTTGQVLAKNSNTNYDLTWSSPHYVVNGGATGQVLTKHSSADFDTTWATPVPNVVNTILDLRALAPNFAPSVEVRGYYATGDGGGGSFYWDASSSTADNTGTVIVPNAGGVGRWIRSLTSSRINVRWFGAKGDGVTDDTLAINKAMTVAIALKGTLYLPSATTFYIGTITIPNGTVGLAIEGDTPGGGAVLSAGGSVISSAGASPTLSMNGNLGDIGSISVKNLRILNTSTGNAILARMCNYLVFRNLICLSSGGTAIDIKGTGDFTLDGVISYAGGSPALKIEDEVGVTASGPGTVIGGQYAIQGGTSPAIVISGQPLGISFLNTFYSSFGPGVPASVTIDGSGAANQVGCVSFIGCHGESNYNSSANTGCDFLIGNANKFGSVSIENHQSFGHGDGTHLLQDAVRIVSARSVSIKDSSFGLGLVGYVRGAIRLEATFPAGADGYRFENNTFSGVGTLYSDANGRITSAVDASYNATLANSLTLGTPLLVPSGGTGLSSGTSGGIPYFSGSTTQASSGVLAANTLVIGGGAGVAPSTTTTPVLGVATATSINKVAITAPATSATLTIPDGVTLTGPASSGTAMTLGNAETVTGAKTFGSAGAVGKLKIAGTTSGSTILDATATASGTLTLPAATDTLIGKATTDTLTNKTYDTAGTGNSFSINGVAATANTGTGSVVRATTPTLVTPVLGVATATSINKMAITTPATSSTLAVADGKTATFNNTITLSGTDGDTISYGAWTSFTPTITSGTGTITTSSATGAYMLMGKTVIFRMALTVTTNGTGATSIMATLPFTAVANTAFSGVTQSNGICLSASTLSAASTLAKAIVFNLAGNYPASDGWVGIISGSFERA